MIGLSHDVQIWLCAGTTDLRKGFDGLAAIAQHVLHQDPYSGHLFVFRGKRGISLRYSGGMVRVTVCSINASSTVGSFGHRRHKGKSLFHWRNYRCYWKVSTGGKKSS